MPSAVRIIPQNTLIEASNLVFQWFTTEFGFGTQLAKYELERIQRLHPFQWRQLTIRSRTTDAGAFTESVETGNKLTLGLRNVNATQLLTEIEVTESLGCQEHSQVDFTFH